MSDITIENKNKKKALGRGLGTLFGSGLVEAPEELREVVADKAPRAQIEKPDQFEVSKLNQINSSKNPKNDQGVQHEGRVWQISIEKLKAGAYQPRTTFEKETLQELAQSIKQNGILQPIIVRKTNDDKFEIIAGERRWRAAQLAGLHELPAIIRTFTDKEALELAIIENVQREDLNSIEEAQGYARLVNEFNLSQQQVAERVGKERATVANLLRILILPSAIKEQIESGILSLGHAKVLLSLSSSDQQVEMGKKAIAEKWSVRKLEKAIADLGKTLNKNEKADVDIDVSKRLIQGLSEELQKSLGTKVSIDYAQGKGKILISFYSDDELSNIVDRLKLECTK